MFLSAGASFLAAARKHDDVGLSFMDVIFEKPADQLIVKQVLTSFEFRPEHRLKLPGDDNLSIELRLGQSFKNHHTNFGTVILGMKASKRFFKGGN